MMKFSFKLLCIIAAALCKIEVACAQGVMRSTKQGAPVIPQSEVKKLREAVLKSPEDLKAHQDYLKAFPSAKSVQAEYDRWIINYPKSSVVPLAIGEKFYKNEMSEARSYLLMAAKLDPHNAGIWEKLANDASRWGEEDKRREYLAQAMAAEPKNAIFALMYANTYMSTDTAMHRKKIWEMADNFPNNPDIALAFSYFGGNLPDVYQRIAAYEKLLGLISPDKNFYSAVAMSRLCEEYIHTGQYRKAIELAGSIADNEEIKRLNFPRLKQTAQALENSEQYLRDGRYDRARSSLMDLEGRQNIATMSRVALSKAAILDARDSTKAAYDSLIILQSQQPGEYVQTALKSYAKKLNITSEQLKRDVMDAVRKKSKPAPSFELLSYLDNKNVKLEDLKGKVIFMTFWFPGCGPCRREMISFHRVISRYEKEKIVYLGVNVAADQDEYVLPFMKNTKYTFNPLSDSGHVTERAYGVRACPSNFIIDQSGNIAYSNFTISADNEDALQLMFDTLIEGQ